MTSVVLVIAITYAWFAFNDHTEGRGMDITVKCPANLIITSDSSNWNPGVTELSRGLIPAEGSDDEPVPSVFETTHKSDSPTGLGYLRNSYEIDPGTGKPKENKVAILDDVIESEVNGKYYYIDYTVYVASFGEAFSSSTVLAASLIDDNENLLNLFKATSVDFLIKGSTDNDYTFAGTLNLAGKDASNLNNDNPKTEVELNTGTIPLYTEGWFEVILRCYFDGNLNDTATKTYITTNEVNALSTNSVTIGVEIYTK